jgi:hypothetical protein
VLYRFWAGSISQTKLEQRVYRAAEATLARQHYVSAIDVLCGMGLLASSAVDSWQKGRIDYLEREIQGSQNKITSSMTIFQRWAQAKGLMPSETAYVRVARDGSVPLRFSLSGDAQIEKNYRTHYVSPTLSERQQQKLQEKLDKARSGWCFRICAMRNVRNAERRLCRARCS